MTVEVFCVEMCHDSHISLLVARLCCVFRKRQQFASPSVFVKAGRARAQSCMPWCRGRRKTKGGCICRHNWQHTTVSGRENKGGREKKTCGFMGCGSGGASQPRFSSKCKKNKSNKEKRKQNSRGSIFTHFPE